MPVIADPALKVPLPLILNANLILLASGNKDLSFNATESVGSVSKAVAGETIIPAFLNLSPIK